jgi:hypothetical protein
MSMWGQLSSFAQQALDKANELAEEVGADAAAAAEQLVGHRALLVPNCRS